MRKTHLMFMTLSLALLAGCGQAPALTAGVQASAGVSQAEAASLSAKIKARFRGFYDRLDVTNDKKWKADDFEMPEDRFLNCFRNIDTDNDAVVTFEEYWPKDRHAELVEDVTARAKVFQMSSGGKTSFDEAEWMFDKYLKKYLPARERKRESQDAFDSADANKDKVLNTAELGHALGIMEAKAFEKYIERQVNRSKGQPEKPTKPINEQ